MMMGISVNRMENNAFLSGSEPEVIDTRFGKIAVKRQTPMVFPRGLLGMPERFNFFLTEFPNKNLGKFKLLQSLDDFELSFITLPIDLENGIIAAEDLSSVSKELGIKIENLGALLVVSVHRSPAKVSLSVNARAPLLIDTATRIAIQHVFLSDKYKVQHPIVA